MRHIGRKITIWAAITATGLALTACGGGSDDTNSKVASISDAANDAAKLENEVYQAVNRLIVDCMEEQEFDIHPQWMTDSYTDGQEEDYRPLDDSRSPDSQDIPSMKDAKKEGFGSNIRMKPGYESEDSEMGAGGEGENDPFYEESEDYQKAYEKAQYGDEYYKWMYDPMGTEDDDSEMTPAPLQTGCTGEVSEKVYGKPITPDPKDEDSEGMGPYYGVEAPDAISDYEKQEELYQTNELMDARDEFSKCVEDAGYPYFESTKGWGMGISFYVDGFYEGRAAMIADNGSGEGPPEYDLPEGAPWKDFDDAFDAEVKLATTVAKCADDSGFRKVSKKAWSAAVEKSVLDGEKEIYAWYDDLKAALEKAQDLIGK